MEIKIKIFDSEGTPVNIGDVLKIQHRSNVGLTFYAKAQIFNGGIFPFNFFAFDRIIKVENVPIECKHITGKEKAPEYWMHPKTELYILENEGLEKWKLDVFMFERSSFFECYQ